MPLFMPDQILVSILCLVVISSSNSVEEPDFIDLSKFDCFISNHLIIFNNTSNMKMKIKCPDCTITDLTRIKCTEKTLIETDIELEGNGNRVSFPFNISCRAQIENKYIFKITDISIHPGSTNMWLSWTPPEADVDYYLLIVMDRNGKYVMNILGATSYQINNLKEKTSYQICIATINKKGITSLFQCNMTLTDFSITGPVTNVTATPEIDKVLLSWSPPEYKRDIPEGYIIYLQPGINNMCRLYIIKSQSVRYLGRKYSCRNTRMIAGSLSRLEIKDLPPESDFNISIFPFNKNKESAITDMTINTKYRESGPVGNLKTDLRKHAEYIYIGFDKPVNHIREILKYRIRIILKRINICSTRNDVIHEDITEETYKNISKTILKKCGSYVVEVAALNGWNINDGVGKTTSVLFNYTVDLQSTLTTDAKFISSNSLIVSIGNMMKDKCENFGFIIGIMDEKNYSNCLTRIISRLDCEEFTREVEKHQKCGIKHIVKNYSLSSSPSYESFISGVFLVGRKYRWTVSKVAAEITQVGSTSIENGENGDCFTDCYNHGGFYRGIRSPTTNGQICAKRNDTEKSDYRGVLSNICSSCLYEGSWNSCHVPQCFSIDSGTGCVDIISKDEEVQSVKIRWSPLKNYFSVIGYIILFHNSNHFCEQANIQSCNNCGTMDALGSQIKSLYLSCKSRDEISTIKYEASFRGLHQNRNYNVYITPIMSATRIGEIMNTTVHTKLGKPHIPSDVRYELDILNKIKFVWGKNIENVTYGPSERYVTYISNKKTMKTVSETLNAESITFSNLEICTEYCFILLSSNRAGESDFSREICTFTLAPKPERVELQDPRSGYMESQALSWTYSGSDNCPKTYLVEYKVKFLRQFISVTTNSTSIVLTRLIPNVIYVVIVLAVRQMKTVNNESNGEISFPKEFYTGKLKPNILYYEQNLDISRKILNISWGIEEEMQESIFVYLIQVKNSMKACIYSVLLTCKTWKEPWIWNNVKDRDKESLKSLMNCATSENDTIEADQTSFNYLLKSRQKFTHFVVKIYGINLMGIHLLNDKSTISTTTSIQLSQTYHSSGIYVSYSVLILLGVVIVVVCLLLFGIHRYVKLKKSISSFNVMKNDAKIKKPFFMKKIKKSKKPKENIYIEEICGELDQGRQNMHLPNTEIGSKLKPRNLYNKIIISAFPAYHEKVSKNGSAKLIKQYRKLSKDATPQEDSLQLAVDVVQYSKNSKKNQSENNVPFNQTRKGPPHDSLHANYIPFANDQKQIEYIAAQGPIDGKISDFWKMIWENNIYCIVMLTRTMEKCKFKCVEYWPNDIEVCILFGIHSQFDVSLVKMETKESHIWRELNVLNTKTKENRKIIQFHMHTWPENSVPDFNLFENFLFSFHETTKENASKPYLIHCSSGAGQIGTFICIDRIIKDVIHGLQEISIYDTVLELRKYWNCMVQQQAQYNFIHDFINHFLAKRMKTEDVDDTYVYDD